jgi:hypothetical protein
MLHAASGRALMAERTKSLDGLRLIDYADELKATDAAAPNARRMNRAACTIISPNYLAFARTLAESYLKHHPGHRFFVLFVADLNDATPFSGDGFTPVMLSEIGLSDLRGEAMKYDILELNTNVKPTFLKYLLAKYTLDAIVYLDPDIAVYAPLDPVFGELERGASVVLTPHMTTPIFDGKSPSEQKLLYDGTYNLGFAAFGNSPESFAALAWWERRCLDLGYSEGRSGLFVDQKWMNLAPGLFNDVAILRDAGCNMAYWNLHERVLDGATVISPNGNVPLRFFHFSGVVVLDADVLSKHTDRFTLDSRPDLRPLFDGYKAAVQANKKPGAEDLLYGFNKFSDGTTVTLLARRMYAMHQDRFGAADPFDSAGPFAQFAREHRLVKGVVAPAKSTWSDFSPRDRRVEAVHSLLKLALRLIGPHKYELLMRYLGYISILRNQSVFLRDPKWAKESDQ